VRAVLALLSVAALSASSPEAPGRAPHSVAVQIANFTFAPQEVVAAIGDTLVWTNGDIFEHVVVADSGAFSSPTLTGGKRYAYVVARAGRITYHCAAHPVMKGTVVVVNAQ
jgi:plastocyanin